MNAQPSLGTKIGRFIALVGALFAITMGVVITQRLSDDALALMTGLACGVVAMGPTLGLGLLIWRRQEQELARAREVSRSTPFMQPPVIVVAPPTLPGYGEGWRSLPAPASPWQVAPAERKFTIVGEE